VLAGLQLASEDLVAGVAMALERPAVAEIGAAVLAALGPVETCPGCKEVGPARHLHRTRGLDTLHGLVCAGCGAVLRSYWRYGELAPYEVTLVPSAVQVVAEDGPLGPGARLAGHGRLELAPAPDAGVTGPELLELLRARIERRFRP
jgi:hypothetical protein